MGLFVRLGRITLVGQQALLLLGAAAALCYALRSVYVWSRLRHIPGPRYAGWSVWWQLSGAVGGRFHEHLKEASDKYGPLVRIGPNELLCTDPETLRRIAGVRSTYTKGPFYDSGRVVPGVDNVISTRDEKRHKEIRAQMAPGFYGKENEDFGFETGMDRQLRKFLDLLDRKYISTETQTRPLDLAEKTLFFALDAIGDISMGAAFGYLEKDEDLYDFNKINAETVPVMGVMSVIPWLIKLVHRWPLRLVLPKETDHFGFGRLMGFAREFVDKRLDSKAEPVKDMMQSHINNGMTAEELIQQVFISIIAGSNSSAHAVRMTILSLIATPPAYAKLLAEIGSARAAASSPISWSHTQELPYLQAVVREGLRMWPPAGGLGFKLVPPAGDVVNGFFVPGGTNIGHNFFGVGRSRLVWGDDAAVFRPERWLLAEGDELRSMVAAVDTHFGHGKYGCLGKSIALMEIHKTIFELLKRYEISIIDPETPIKTQASIFFLASDFWVRLTERVW